MAAFVLRCISAADRDSGGLQYTGTLPLHSLTAISYRRPSSSTSMEWPPPEPPLPTYTPTPASIMRRQCALIPSSSRLPAPSIGVTIIENINGLLGWANAVMVCDGRSVPAMVEV